MVVGVAALGPAKTVATRLTDVAVTVLGFAPSPHFMSQIRRGTEATFDDEELVRRLSPTPAEELVAARRILLAAVVVLGGVTAGAAWSIGERVQRQPQGVRGYIPPSFRVDRRESVPLPERGRDVMHCNLSPEERAAKREAAAERSVFAKMAEIERQRNPRPVVEPDFGTKRKHHAAPGGIYAISASRLHRIYVNQDGSVVADPAQDLEVRLPRDNTPRLYPMAPVLRSLTIDRYGALLAVGDGRLYQCSPDTAVCFPRGVLPHGTQSVFAQLRADGQTLVAVDEFDRWGAVEMLYPSGSLADVLADVMADVELCVDLISLWQPDPPPTSNPTRGFDGRLYASVYDFDARQTVLAVLDPRTGAVRERIAALTKSRSHPSLLALPEGLFVFRRQGSVTRYDPVSRKFTIVGRLDFEVHGVAAYFDPAIAPE